MFRLKDSAPIFFSFSEYPFYHSSFNITYFIAGWKINSFHDCELRAFLNLKNSSGKGQIISKGLFCVLEFSQKTNERIRCSSKNEFVRSFFERI